MLDGNPSPFKLSMAASGVLISTTKYLSTDSIITWPSTRCPRTRSHLSSGSKGGQRSSWGVTTWHFLMERRPAAALAVPTSHRTQMKMGWRDREWWCCAAPEPVWGCENLRSEDWITLSPVPTVSLLLWSMWFIGASSGANATSRNMDSMSFMLVWDCLWALVFLLGKIAFWNKTN